MEIGMEKAAGTLLMGGGRSAGEVDRERERWWRVGR
jgi:hypothetical protein